MFDRSLNRFDWWTEKDSRVDITRFRSRLDVSQRHLLSALAPVASERGSASPRSRSSQSAASSPWTAEATFTNYARVVFTDPDALTPLTGNGVDLDVNRSTDHDLWARWAVAPEILVKQTGLRSAARPIRRLIDFRDVAGIPVR